jgi:peptidoglycan/LPS O-acetylase OafA/YrhL
MFQRGVRFFDSFRAVAQTKWIGSLITFEPGLGVFLFFSVSGFILATQACKAKNSPLSGTFLKAYFGRRILRIEPPYIVLLLATWTFLTLTGYRPEGTQQFFTAPDSINLSLLTSIFYAHDLVWGTFPRLFPPGWTLEVEVQFYLMAPLLFWAWFRLESPRVRAGLALGVWFVANLIATILQPKIGAIFVGYSILRYFSFFWLGMVLADSREWVASVASRLSPGVATTIGWLGVVGLVSLPEFPDALPFGLVMRCMAGLAVAMMFVGVFANESGFRRFCGLPWISLIGGACYSIYHLHIQPIQTSAVFVAKHAAGLPFFGVAAMMAAQVALVLVVGLTFYVCVERPFMTPHWPTRAIAWLRARTGSISAAEGSNGETAASAAPLN